MPVTVRAWPFVVLLMVGPLLAACGSAEITTTPDPAPAAEPVTVTVTETVALPVASEPAAVEMATAAAETVAAPELGTAGVGDSITIAGQADGEEARIKLIKVEKYAGEGYFKPDAGEAWWAIRLQFTNTGTAVLDECAGNDVSLVMDTDEEADTAFADRKPDLGCFKIRAGKKRVGWLVFTAPKNARPASLQVSLNSGFADAIAEFTLRP
jgi:Domain of unknown function (DUF4352)